MEIHNPGREQRDLSMIFWRASVVILATVLLTACITGDANRPLNPLQDSNLSEALENKKPGGLSDPFNRAGVRALEEGNFVATQAGLNRAFKFDPTRSQLHFLNELKYHLRAAAGDSSQKDFAAIGYRLALQYNAANYWAAYQLGHINFNDRRYRKAQNAFAYALLFAP